MKFADVNKVGLSIIIQGYNIRYVPFFILQSGESSVIH
jgi:hypothetical protein